MKKTLLVVLTLMIGSAAGAQVTRGTVGEGSYTDWSNETSTRFGLDFNNDGICEFAVNYGYAPSAGTVVNSGAVEYVYDSGNNVRTDEATWDFFNLLEVGYEINSSCGFNGAGDCYFFDYAAIGDCAYVGFRLKYGNDYHYAYAKVSFADDTIVYWNEIYHNATPNASIAVGQTSGGAPVGIETADGGHFVVAAMDGHRINILQQHAGTVAVYDLGGRQVATAQGVNSTVALPGSGVYVVRSATATAKIFVH